MPRPLTMIVFVLLGILTVIVLSDAIRTSFVKLGVPRGMVGAVVIASLVGSAINVPLWERSVGFARAHFVRVGGYLYYDPPHMERQLVAVNVGGAIIPTLISLWLLHDATLWKTLVAFAVVVVITRLSARIVPGKGIQMPLLIAPFSSALLAIFLTWGGGAAETAPIAYIAGSMGTLVGADLLNLGRLDEMGGGVMSIGGAGVLDGVFLVGLVAAFIA